MSVHRYYAVIQPTDEGNYIVTFPDVDGCITQGETLQEAIVMAEDALGMMLVDMEVEGKLLSPSPVDKLKASLPDGASLVYIEVDTDEYREAV